MKKAKCEFDGKVIECPVIENMGYQCGVYLISVKFNNEERVVQRYPSEKIYRLRTVAERFGRAYL
jgi:hypothetical protein